MKEKFFEQVIRLRIPIIVLFIIVALAGAVGRQELSVNYDMNDYLPPSHFLPYLWINARGIYRRQRRGRSDMD